MYDSVCSVLLVARYAQWFTMENHGNFGDHISSSRKPTVAIVSHIIDLDALYPFPLPFLSN